MREIADNQEWLFGKVRICAVIAAYNEEKTVGEVVRETKI